MRFSTCDEHVGRDVVREGDPGRLVCAREGRDDASPVAPHHGQLARQQPGCGDEAEGLVVVLGRLTDASHRHRHRGSDRDLAQRRQAGAEVLADGLAELVEAGGWGCR